MLNFQNFPCAFLKNDKTVGLAGPFFDTNCAYQVLGRLVRR